MKKNTFIILCTIIITGCNTDIQVSSENENLFYNNRVEFLNYEGSGIDFILLPANKKNSNMTKAPSGEDGTVVEKSQEYDLISIYPNESDSVFTQILVERNNDGSVIITHMADDYIFASLHFDESGILSDIIIPDENAVLGAVGDMYRVPASLSSFYRCINMEYQRIKQIIQSDVVNDIVCDMTFPLCRTLMVMTAVEYCR